MPPDRLSQLDQIVRTSVSDELAAGILIVVIACKLVLIGFMVATEILANKSWWPWSPFPPTLGWVMALSTLMDALFVLRVTFIAIGAERILIADMALVSGLGVMSVWLLMAFAHAQGR